MMLGYHLSMMMNVDQSSKKDFDMRYGDGEMFVCVKELQP